MFGKGPLPPSGIIFDSGPTIGGQPAPFGHMRPDGHVSTYWPEIGQYSWNNPGQTGGHWSEHTPGGKVPGQLPPGAQGG